MKAFLTRKTIVITAIAVLIAIITIISTNVFGSGGPVNSLTNYVSRPFRELAMAVARTFESIYSSIYRYEDLHERYEAALSDLATSERANRESDDLLREVNSLRALLGFRERHAGLVLEEADVVNLGGNNWASTFTISKGYANSLTPMARGSSVVTAYGVLIGQVTDVGATSSTVVSILDTRFSAGAHVGEGGGSATVKGDFSLMNSGLLMLDHFSEETIVLPGDSVVTSSAGGIFPAGLVVGEIVEVLRHGTGVGSYAIVRPMREIDNSISDVYVVTSFEITG